MLKILRNFSTKASSFKVYSSETPAKGRALVDSIAEASNQQAYFAWHPKKDFPYEFTKPIPRKPEIIKTSLLKEDAMEEALKAYKLQYPDLVRENLSKLTFTTKHRWFPRSRDKKAKKTRMDRRYL
jgi:large subunit ribosomal protein L42